MEMAPPNPAICWASSLVREEEGRREGPALPWPTREAGLLARVWMMGVSRWRCFMRVCLRRGARAAGARLEEVGVQEGD